MVGKLTEFEKLPNGTLRIELLPEARDDVQEIALRSDWDADDKLREVITWHLGNGWTWLRPEEIGALTSAPLLSEDVAYDDYGDVQSVGDVYWYAAYEVYDPVEQLLEHGYVDFV